MKPIDIPLDDIRYILLDLDGTLLDKYFDDYFWEHLVPEKYAELHDISFGRAKEELMKNYKQYEGTLNWTDLDFWSRELNLDIPALKEQLHHLIDVHPHVEDFLAAMRKKRKKIYLLTNAHMKSIDLKFRKTGIGKYFHKVIASYEMGHPKEDMPFWHKAQGILGFEPEHSLFVDDTEAILRTSQAYGIRYNVLKTAASSKETALKASKDFPVIRDFNELGRWSEE